MGGEVKKPLRDHPSLAISDGLRCACGAPLDPEDRCIVSGRCDWDCQAPHAAFRDRPYQWCLSFGDMIGMEPTAFLKENIRYTRKSYFDALKREAQP
jgi:hypothetical protein